MCKEKIQEIMKEVEETYKNKSGRVQEVFSVGFWLMRVSEVGLNDTINELGKAVNHYIERGES